MSYYADLTPFEYGGHECPEGSEPVNIGWLGDTLIEEGEVEGEVTETFVNRLKYLVDNHRACTYRGSHECPFCYKSFGDGRVHMKGSGNGQVHVKGEGNRWYVAPALIHHYVKEHGYKPPQEFIDAVMKNVMPDLVKALGLFPNRNKRLSG